MRRPGSIPTYNAQTLYLRVNPPISNGRVSRQWRQRLQIDGQQRWLGLGGYPVVTIDEARDKAIDNRRTVRKGGDPRSRQRSDAPTFEKAVVEVIGIHSPAGAKAVRQRSRGARPCAVRQRISTVMNWSIAQGYRTDNPAGEAISAALPKRSTPPVHFRALPFAEAGSAVTLISGLDHAALATRLAFRLLVLTAVRSGEVRGARWDEIDVG